MRRLAQRDNVAPRDLSVLAFDNIFGADFCSPPLTTLAERTDEAGSSAVEALVLQVNSGTTHDLTRLPPTQLVIRDSPGPPPTPTRRVAR